MSDAQRHCTLGPNACHQCHRLRHVMLHRALDELAADFMVATARRPSETTVLELITWSHQQTINPTRKVRL